jgi:hypothetical protein
MDFRRNILFGPPLQVFYSATLNGDHGNAL